MIYLGRGIDFLFFRRGFAGISTPIVSSGEIKITSGLYDRLVTLQPLSGIGNFSFSVYPFIMQIQSELKKNMKKIELNIPTKFGVTGSFLTGNGFIIHDKAYCSIRKNIQCITFSTEDGSKSIADFALELRWKIGVPT